MRIVGWIIKHQLLLWHRRIRRSIRRGHDSSRRSSHRQEGSGYLMTGSTGDTGRPSPIPRAVLAGVLAGIAAADIRYSGIKRILGMIIGFIPGATVGSPTLFLFHTGRAHDQRPPVSVIRPHLPTKK